MTRKMARNRSALDSALAPGASNRNITVIEMIIPIYMVQRVNWNDYTDLY